MFILIVLSGVAYLAVGIAFTMLSLHELATSRRDRILNRLVAWSGIVLWLPILVAVAISAFLVSLRPAHRQAPAMATRPDAALAERRTIRRAARQV